VLFLFPSSHVCSHCCLGNVVVRTGIFKIGRGHVRLFYLPDPHKLRAPHWLIIDHCQASSRLFHVSSCVLGKSTLSSSSFPLESFTSNPAIAMDGVHRSTQINTEMNAQRSERVGGL